MFDMGFTEMMLIGIVALIVIGPERLPGVARTAGKYFGRLKRFVTTVKADVEQELRADELREILAKQQQELDSLKSTISDAGREIEKEGADLVDKLDPTPADPDDQVSHADGALTDNDETLAAAEAEAAAKAAAAEADATAKLEAEAAAADEPAAAEEPLKQSAADSKS